MAETTAVKMARVEQKVENQGEDMKQVKVDVREVKQLLVDLPGELDKLYARKDAVEEIRKEVNRINGWGVWLTRLVGAALIAAILWMIIKQPLAQQSVEVNGTTPKSSETSKQSAPASPTSSSTPVSQPTSSPPTTNNTTINNKPDPKPKDQSKDCAINLVGVCI